MFSSDFRRLIHNVMAAESHRCRWCEMGIKGKSNRSMAGGLPNFLRWLMNFRYLPAAFFQRIFGGNENLGRSGYLVEARKSMYIVQCTSAIIHFVASQMMVKIL